MVIIEKKRKTLMTMDLENSMYQMFPSCSRPDAVIEKPPLSACSESSLCPHHTLEYSRDPPFFPVSFCVFVSLINWVLLPGFDFQSSMASTVTSLAWEKNIRAGLS